VPVRRPAAASGQGAHPFIPESRHEFSCPQIGEELQSRYRLGYVPDANAASDGSYRVELALPRNKKLFIQTRDGYYAGE